MINIYANQIIKGQMTIEDVPPHMREDVQKRVDEKQAETYMV